MSFTEDLARLSNTLSIIADLQGRSFGIQSGICSENEDPKDRRRIKIAPENKGGSISTDWAERINFTPGVDPPVPKVGDVVYFGYIHGDPHKAVYFGSGFSEQNPADPQQSQPLVDKTEEVIGDLKEVIVGQASRLVTEDYKIQSDTEIRANVWDTALSLIDQLITFSFGDDQVIKIEPGKATIDLQGLSFLVQGNSVTVTSELGSTLTLSGGATGWTINLHGNTLNFTNGVVKIAGIDAIVVGSTDSDGDVNNTRGY